MLPYPLLRRALRLAGLAATPIGLAVTTAHGAAIPAVVVLRHERRQQDGRAAAAEYGEFAVLNFPDNFPDRDGH